MYVRLVLLSKSSSESVWIRVFSIVLLNALHILKRTNTDILKLHLLAFSNAGVNYYSHGATNLQARQFC